MYNLTKNGTNAYERSLLFKLLAKTKFD